VFNPRSLLPLAANFGDRQVTKRKELACRYHRVGMATNFDVGLRATRVTLWRAIVRIGAFKMFSRPNFCWAHYEGTSYKLRRGVKAGTDTRRPHDRLLRSAATPTCRWGGSSYGVPLAFPATYRQSLPPKFSRERPLP
jgi:hypothetical protein